MKTTCKTCNGTDRIDCCHDCNGIGYLMDGKRWKAPDGSPAYQAWAWEVWNKTGERLLREENALDILSGFDS